MGPVRVIALNTLEHWSENVSADIAASNGFRANSHAANTPIGSSACLMAKPSVGIKARFLGFIEPDLATSIEKPPKGARWIHEIKFDGYRVQVHIANSSVKVFTRRGSD